MSELIPKLNTCNMPAHVQVSFGNCMPGMLEGHEYYWKMNKQPHGARKHVDNWCYSCSVPRSCEKVLIAVHRGFFF